MGVSPSSLRRQGPRLIIGVISDTHGLLRSEALTSLRGVERIIHAGDIGSPQILEQLATIAPVTAVRGNNDVGEWAEKLPHSVVIEIGTQRICVVHDIADLDKDPIATGCTVAIAGHSHKPSITHRDGVLFLNPGSAGPRRFKLPIAVGLLTIDGDGARAEIRQL